LAIGRLLLYGCRWWKGNYAESRENELTTKTRLGNYNQGLFFGKN
jgi:hypothetical protein